MTRATWRSVAVSAMAAAWLVGCGSSDTTTKPDAGALPADAAVQPPDLNAGSWRLEPLSNTAGTISHDGRLAFTADGERYAAWSDPDSVNLSDQDIYVASGASWGATPLTSGTVQYAFPSMVAQGGAVHLAFNGPGGGSNPGDADIFYVQHQASGWSAKVDLTSPFEGANPRLDYQPSIAISPAGQLAVAYVSQPIDASGNPSGPVEVRVIRFGGGGSPSAPETVIPAMATSTAACSEPSAAFDANGKLHVVSACGEVFQADVYYATDVTGAWTSRTIPGTETQDDGSPEIVADPSSARMHLVWSSGQPCASGTGTCEEIYYLRIENNALTPIVHVTNTGDASEYQPRMAVDRFGRIVIAYHRFNAQDRGDIFLTWSGDGAASFAPERTLTPNTDTQEDVSVGAVRFHPVTGLPHLVYQRVDYGTDPLNADIMHAEYVLP